LQDQERRYQHAEGLKIHHSEAAVFIDEVSPGWHNGLFTPSLQPSVRVDRIGHVSVSFLLNDIPFSNNRYERFFRNLGNYPECIQTLTYVVGAKLELEENIEVKKIGFLKLKDDLLFDDGGEEEWVDGIICKNPFYDGIKFEDKNDSIFSDRTLDLLKSFENCIVFLPYYDTVGSESTYYLREVRLIRVLSSGFSSLCVNAIGYRNDY